MSIGVKGGKNDNHAAILPVGLRKTGILEWAVIYNIKITNKSKKK